MIRLTVKERFFLFILEYGAIQYKQYHQWEWYIQIQMRCQRTFFRFFENFAKIVNIAQN